jgi:hypothetical protein
VIKAIRVFARPAIHPRTILENAAFLLKASDRFSAVETIFLELNKSAGEFIDLLRLTVDGEKCDRQRMVEIVRELAPVLKTPRGRKPTAASAAHEFLLQHLQCGYTWHVDEEDYSDALTQATRAEFSDPRFSPRAARRRVNARQNLSSCKAFSL